MVNNNIFHATVPLSNTQFPSLLGASIAGIAVYLSLSSIHLITSIAITSCVLVSITVYALSNYYLSTEKNSKAKYNDSRDQRSSILFLGLYLSIMLILLIPFPSEPDLEIYLPWKTFSAMDLIRLGASILMVFFLPGYALVDSVFGSIYRRSHLLRVLLSFLLSMFISGTTLYALSILGFPITEASLILILIYLVIIIIFILRYLILNGVRRYAIHLSVTKYLFDISVYFRTYIWHWITFSGIFGLIVLTTYSVYGGIIIGDQWFHHGRALLYLTGTYKDFYETGTDDIYPPILPAILSSLFYFSNIPSVNAYASIAFLNFIPAVAYYFFFIEWVPPAKKRAALLASTLLIFSSGFGWVGVLSDSITNPPADTREALLRIDVASKQTYDILTPSTFFFSNHPDFSTGEPLIMLTAGFVLLGLIKYKNHNSNIRRNKISLFVILTLITLLGIFSHDEFYIFIIISSIVPILFNLKDKVVVYLSFISSILLVLLIDTVSPIHYFTAIYLFELPLPILVLIFVIFMMVIYTTEVLKNISMRFKRLILTIRLNRAAYPLSLLIIISTVYLYVSGLLVWQDTQVQSILAAERPTEKDIPWFVYPIKLGTIGILGSAYLISYFFKRFENEIFIFGIFVLVALFAGSYYDEHRFSKYVMAGMVGLASLLVYEIIIKIRWLPAKPVITGVLIAAITVSCSISVLMFVGHHASTLDTGNLDLIIRRRSLPTDSEFQLLNFLQPHGPINQSFNIATFSKEYVHRQNLTSYFQAFSALPNGIVMKNIFLLNSSSLQGLYDQLEENNVRYLVLAKKDIQSSRHLIPDAVSFAIDNFPIAYEDKYYTVLNVPNLGHSNPKAQTALVYQKNPSFYSAKMRNSTLYFNETSFRFSNNSNIIRGPTPGLLTLDGSRNGEVTLLSKNIESRKINYIQTKFRVLNQAGGHCGVVWEDASDKKYYTRIGKEDLQFSVTPRSNANTIVEAKTGAVETMKWYTMKLLFIDGLLRVHLNDVAIFETQLDGDELIKNVGIRCRDNVAEFGTLDIGRVADPAISYGTQMNLNYYYPLSALALSEIKYDTVVQGDRSVFSKRNVVLPIDSLDENEINTYLEFAKRGGNLFIINPDYTFVSNIMKIFAIEPENKSRFDIISESGSGKPSLRTRGTVNTVQVQPGEGYVKSVYKDEDKVVAPLAIQKNHGKGTITLINAGGYFDSIFKHPKENFGSLSGFTKLIGVNASENMEDDVINSRYPIRFGGDMDIRGHTLINSSSIDFGLENSQYGLYADRVSLISDKGLDEATILEDTTINRIELSGAYEVLISADGHSRLPSSLSFEDYLAISIPQGFNMTVKLSNASSMKLMTKDTEDEVMAVGKTIRFDAVRKNMSDSMNVQVIMKSPEIRVIEGKSSFDRLYVGEFNPWLSGNPLGQSTELNGNLTAEIGHVDIINTRDDNRQKVKYVTYLTSLNYDKWEESSPSLKIPGELPLALKNIDPIWKSTIVSENSILVLALVASVTSILLYLYRRRKFQYLKS